MLNLKFSKALEVKMRKIYRKFIEYNEILEQEYVEMANNDLLEKITANEKAFHHSAILVISFIWGLVNIENVAVISKDAPLVICILAGLAFSILYIWAFNWAYSRLYMVIKYNVGFMRGGSASGILSKDSIQKPLLILNYGLMLFVISGLPMILNKSQYVNSR